MPFQRLGLDEEICRALKDAGYEKPTKIQSRAIPIILQGLDLSAHAQTGTGKTLAFAAPLLQRLDTGGNRQAAAPRILCVVPTRELALQVFESFQRYGAHKKQCSCVLFGGLKDKSNEKKLESIVDIIVATPGRLLDLLKQERVDLSDVRCLVLDEADRMLDLGFFPDIRRILEKVPSERQTLFFCATFPPRLRNQADALLNDAKEVSVDIGIATGDQIEQKVFFVPMRRKLDLLIHLIKEKRVSRCLVFARTRVAADRISEALVKAKIASEAFHSDRSQRKRIAALKAFQNGELRALVASDVASRGLDVDAVTHVFNYDLPNDADTYVHRVGRTGRAGASGVAISLCDSRDFDQLRRIEGVLRTKIPVVLEHPFRSGAMLPPPPGKEGRGKRRVPGKAKIPHAVKRARFERKKEEEAKGSGKAGKKRGAGKRKTANKKRAKKKGRKKR